MKALKIFVPILSLFIISCENFTWFQSEDTIKKQITGTWEREFLADTTMREIWIFQDGNLDIYQWNGSDTSINDHGKFLVDTKLNTALLKTSELTAPQHTNNYNHKWTIVELDDNILYIAADDAEGTGNVQREFNKKK